MNNHITPGGSRLREHRERRIPFRRSDGDGALIERVVEHVEKHVGEVVGAIHEMESDLVHVDVHFTLPTRKAPFFTLVTSGMSEAPMRFECEEGHLGFARGELVMRLPEWWPMGEAGKGSRFAWPFRKLVELARFPHEYDTCLGYGHTLCESPCGTIDKAVRFCGVILLPSFTLPKEFRWMGEPGKGTEFLACYPLYPEEMHFKLEYGTDALIERMRRYGITDVADLERVNAATGAIGSGSPMPYSRRAHRSTGTC